MRPLSLRQIEAFRALVETGTVNKAADALYISQPAVSKLLTLVEENSGLELFDRSSRRLVLTERGMRLYEEIDRIFAGVDQVNHAVEMVRREDRGRLNVGVIPGLSGKFVANVVKDFRESHPEAFVVVDTRPSQYLAEWLVNRQLDVGMLMEVDHPELVSVPLIDAPLVCIMPIGHPLSRLKKVTPENLEKEPFIAFGGRSLIERRFERQGMALNKVLQGTTSINICEMVAAGLGVSVMHPLLAFQVQGRVEVRPFTPKTSSHFLISYPKTGRNLALVHAFIEKAQAAARASVDEFLE